MLENILKLIPENIQATLALRYFSFSKIPLLFLVRPSVMEISSKKVIVKIPFRRKTRNHLGCMYVGALAMGAELAAGLMAVKFIKQSQYKISLVFKNFTADFLKRAEDDTIFICEDGDAIGKIIQSTEETGERQQVTVNVVAKVPTKLGEEPVAKFTITISLKRK